MNVAPRLPNNNPYPLEKNPLEKKRPLRPINNAANDERFLVGEAANDPHIQEDSSKTIIDGPVKGKKFDASDAEDVDFRLPGAVSPETANFAIGNLTSQPTPEQREANEQALSRLEKVKRGRASFFERLGTIGGVIKEKVKPVQETVTKALDSYNNLPPRKKLIFASALAAAGMVGGGTPIIASAIAFLRLGLKVASTKVMYDGLSGALDKKYAEMEDVSELRKKVMKVGAATTALLINFAGADAILNTLNETGAFEKMKLVGEKLSGIFPQAAAATRPEIGTGSEFGLEESNGGIIQGNFEVNQGGGGGGQGNVLNSGPLPVDDVDEGEEVIRTTPSQQTYGFDVASAPPAGAVTKLGTDGKVLWELPNGTFMNTSGEIVAGAPPQEAAKDLWKDNGPGEGGSDAVPSAQDRIPAHSESDLVFDSVSSTGVGQVSAPEVSGSAQGSPKPFVTEEFKRPPVTTPEVTVEEPLIKDGGDGEIFVATKDQALAGDSEATRREGFLVSSEPTSTPLNPPESMIATETNRTVVQATVDDGIKLEDRDVPQREASASVTANIPTQIPQPDIPQFGGNISGIQETASGKVSVPIQSVPSVDSSPTTTEVLSVPETSTLTDVQRGGGNVSGVLQDSLSQPATESSVFNFNKNLSNKLNLADILSTNQFNTINTNSKYLEAFENAAKGVAQAQSGGLLSLLGNEAAGAPATIMNSFNETLLSAPSMTVENFLGADINSYTIAQQNKIKEARSVLRLLIPPGELENASVKRGSVVQLLLNTFK